MVNSEVAEAIKQAEEQTQVTPVQEVCSLLQSNKAILIEGEDFWERQKLAADAVTKLQRREERHLTGELTAYSTTPSLNEVHYVKSFRNPNTGIVFDRLPRAEELRGGGNSIIVLDGISQQGPSFPGLWMNYVDLPNTRFILLSHITVADSMAFHRERQTAAKWLELFEGKKTATGRMEYSKFHPRWSFVNTSPAKGR